MRGEWKGEGGGRHTNLGAEQDYSDGSTLKGGAQSAYVSLQNNRWWGHIALKTDLNVTHVRSNTTPGSMIHAGRDAGTVCTELEGNHTTTTYTSIVSTAPPVWSNESIISVHKALESE